MTAETERKIREGMHELGRGLHSMSDIAHSCGVSESTVRKHRDELVHKNILQYTSYVRYMTAGQAVT